MVQGEGPEKPAGAPGQTPRNAASVRHKRAGAPEKKHELIQLPPSKDTSVPEARLQGPKGMQAGQIMEEPEGQALLQAGLETS